jgi:hypothetical protein
MKQELPFAVVLLAAGCVLWFWQSNHEKTPVFSSSPSENAAEPIPIAGMGEFEIEPFQVAQAGFQTEAFLPQESDSRKIPTEIEISQPISAQSFPKAGIFSNNAFIHAQPNRQSVQLMSQISQRLASSQPFGLKLRLSGQLFETAVLASGNYAQMGQGTFKSRIELKFGSEQNAATVFQLCDGRFVYNLQTSPMPHSAKGKKQTFEFVDLVRVQETAGESQTKITPTGWVATGGISSLFQHLASAFNFGASEQTDDSAIVLRGSWDQNSLQSVLFNPLDGESRSQPQIRWEDVPKQLPHAVELVLQKNSEFDYFPSKITFLQFVKQKDDQYKLDPVVTLLLSEPQPLGAVSDRFFVIDSSNLKPTDATDGYIARIEAFEEIRQAAQLETLERK